MASVLTATAKGLEGTDALAASNAMQSCGAIMKVGLLKELKQNENRVALTPNGTKALTGLGIDVFVEKGAGIGSGFPDSAYVSSGARIEKNSHDVCKKSEFILKVKEPLDKEYGLFSQRHTIFAFFHFAANRVLLDAMLKHGTACIAYETVQKKDGTLPLLAPMSEVAGKMAAQVGAYYLAKPPGKGVLMSSVSNAKPAKVVVIGGGFVGSNVARVSAAMGADVIILEANESKIALLKKSMPANVSVAKSDPVAVREAVRSADVLVGAALVPGRSAPKVVSEEMVHSMENGSVIIDVAIDQGGCVATSKPTTHKDPVFIKHGVIHYCVTNMPAAFPRTSTEALTAATLPYVLKLAKNGLGAIADDDELRKGLNTFRGEVTNPTLAETFGLRFKDPLEALSLA